MSMNIERTTQLELFELSAGRDHSLADDAKSFFCDPSFASNKTQPIHRWAPWIAGFASDFVRDALHRYLDSAGTVLDPFAGVGTTLVEAMLCGHKAVGFEINPYAAQVCRAKVNAWRISVQAFYDQIDDFCAFYQDKISGSYTPKSASPQGFKTRSEFYSPQVLRKVLIVLDFMQGLNSDLDDLFKLAFAATMVQYSNYSYEPSLGRRTSAGKPEIQDFPVGQTISDKLTEMAQDIAWQILANGSQSRPLRVELFSAGLGFGRAVATAAHHQGR